MNPQPWVGTLERARRCSTAKGREQQGLFSIEGERLVRRALHAGIQLESVLIADNSVSDAKTRALQGEIEQRGIEWHCVPEAVLLELAEGRNSGRCVALAPLLKAPSLAHWLSALGEGAPALVLMVVGVEEPGNVGALARTALASGVSAFAQQGSTDLFHPKAVRSSMGSVFKLAHCGIGDLSHASAHLRVAGFCQVAAVANGGQSLPEAKLSAPRLALYVGNEAQGLPPEVTQRVDTRVTIPMPTGVDSFSINAASAIVLYEVQRQRQGRA